MSLNTTLKRFLSEGNTGNRFGHLEYKSVTKGQKGPDFQILVKETNTPEDIEAAKKYLNLLFNVKSIDIINEISEEETFGLYGEEEPSKPPTIFDALKSGFIQDFDDEINLNDRF